MKKYRSHLVIPDTQIKEGVPIDHILAAARYAAEKQPDVIVFLGDWWDFPSLSAWDSSAQKVAEKTAYLKGVDSEDNSLGDIGSGNYAMREFWKIIRRRKKYMPESHFFDGNHEHRCTRARHEQPELGEAISLSHRWFDPATVVHGFLQPRVIDGISYCHYYCMDSNGRVTNSKRGQASARAQVQNVGMSATAGHKQGLDTHIKEVPGGRRRGIIAGSFYQHSEDYLSPQGNAHWQGCLHKHEVRQGDYDLMELSLEFLLKRYG